MASDQTAAADPFFAPDLLSPAVAPEPPRATDSAFAQVAAISTAEAGAPDARKLRVAVLGGGCSGFQYEFSLTDDVGEDDLVLEKDGVSILIDSVSLPFLGNAVIDYTRELIGARFVIVNPNAASTCGCGTSFSV